jgi:hypothetical protein
MISTPRCGEPVKYFELRRIPDEMDIIPRSPGRKWVPCFRPKGHPGSRHASEWSYRRDLALAVVRNRARRARRRRNDSAR